MCDPGEPGGRPGPLAQLVEHGELRRGVTGAVGVADERGHHGDGQGRARDGLQQRGDPGEGHVEEVQLAAHLGGVPGGAHDHHRTGVPGEAGDSVLDGVLMADVGDGDTLVGARDAELGAQTADEQDLKAHCFLPVRATGGSGPE